MRGDEPNLHGKIDENAAQAVSPEKQEEMKLMNKLASSGGLPAKGPSSFLQKRLQHRKFFDSGDYAMDKAKKGGGGAATTPSRGGAAPTTIVEGGSLSVVVADEHMELRSPSPVESDAPSTGLEIPRPETVPQRKSSIIYPSAHSKLSPQPHLHHASSDAQETL